MARSLALDGTGHTVSLHRTEGRIFDAIRHALGVRKLKPNRVEYAGPSRLRIELREGMFPWLVLGRLFIGSGQRHFHVYVDPNTELAALRTNVAKALDWAVIEVSIERREQMQVSSDPGRGRSAEEQWVECLVVYEFVSAFKKFEDEELVLQLQLDEVRKQKTEARDKAVAARRSLSGQPPSGL